MSDNNVQIAITLAWVGHPDEAPWNATEQRPSIEGLVQLFYGITLLYTESLDLKPGDPRLQSSRPLSWRASLVQWRRLVRRPSIRRRWIGPPAHDWPGFVPLPGVPRGSELRVSGMAMASPLELELAVPAAAIASPVGVYAVLRFIDAIEHAWKQRFLDHLRIALACPRSLDLDRARDQGTLALYVFRSTHEHHRRGAVSRPRSQAVPLTSPSLPTLSTRPRSMSI